MNTFWTTSDESLNAEYNSAADISEETTDPNRLPRMIKLLKELKCLVEDAIEAGCDNSMDDLSFLELCVEVFRDNYPFDEEIVAES
jgi:hypothetical protein